jgi:hypothetical protein
MRRAFYTLVIVGLICGSAKISADMRKPVDAPTGYSFGKITTLNGLPMALPSNLRNVPVELVPEP